MSIFGWDTEYIGGDCPECGEHFSRKQTTLTVFSYRWFVLLKLHKHLKKHNASPLSKKDVRGLYWKIARDQTLSILFVFLLVPVVYMVSWATYPFWWVHEFVWNGKVSK